MTASTGLPTDAPHAARATAEGLLIDGHAVLHWGTPWPVLPDATGAGVFLLADASGAASSGVLALGMLAGLRRFTGLHRHSPYWTRPFTGTSHAQVPAETTWLLAETGAGCYTMVVPLIDDTTSFCLGTRGGQLAVLADTGDPATPLTAGPAVFVATGDDPYRLVAAGARAIEAHLGTGRLRTRKPVPDFVDLLGWCTWDAFYKDVSADGVLAGLASLARAGAAPGFVIVDDGWQQWRRGGSGEDRLVDLAPNDRFGGDFTALVREAKERYGVRRVLAWHALLGYWGGLDDDAFARHGTRSVARRFGAALQARHPHIDTEPWGAQVGVPAREALADFHDELHASLAAQGIDGVKVDVQAVVEAVAAGQGGRVAYARAARRSLEASAERHFGGRVVNCMSCTAECAYLAAGTTLMRTSDDFFPDQPASHGAHLHANALASLWYGEFMLPDWDMFQSAHEHGAFHAAARAISGGPVYVSDRVGEHDAALLRQLVLGDGRVLRADRPARPSPDSLFTDPIHERVLLKVFNQNGDRGVVGLFNVSQVPGEATSRIGPDDVPTLDPGREHVAWSRRGDRLWRCGGRLRASIVLPQGGWELVSFAPIEHGFAVLGLADKLNGGAAITTRTWSERSCEIGLRDGGTLLAWAAATPCELWWGDTPLPFAHDPASGRLTCDVPRGAHGLLTVIWPERASPIPFP